MLNLFDIKLNNADFYTYIQDSLPSTPLSGSYLLASDDFAPSYFKGLTYLTPDGINWNEAETKEKTIYNNNKYKLIHSLLSYLNNNFYVNRRLDYTFYPVTFTTGTSLSLDDINHYLNYVSYYDAQADFDGKTITLSEDYSIFTDQLQAGDLIKISNSRRNDKYAAIESIVDNVITVDVDLTTMADDEVLLFLVYLPDDICSALAMMFYYDLYKRSNDEGIAQSERIGNYSITKKGNEDFINIGGRTYPKYVVNNLNAYKIVNFK